MLKISVALAVGWALCGCGQQGEDFYLKCVGHYREKADQDFRDGMSIDIAYRMNEARKSVLQRTEDGDWTNPCVNGCTLSFGSRYIRWESQPASPRGDQSIRYTVLIDRMTGDESITSNLVTAGENPSVAGVGESRLHCEPSDKEPAPERKF